MTGNAARPCVIKALDLQYGGTVCLTNWAMGEPVVVKSSVAIIFSVTFAFRAAAEPCPQGISSAGNPSCLPPSTPQYDEMTGLSAPRPLGRWHTTYGSFFVDMKTGASGVSTDKRSKREAKRVAQALCATGGNTNCKELMTFHNQCAAVAFPAMGEGRASLRRGPSTANVGEGAVADCREISGRECKLVYSGCSKPVFESF